MAMIASKVTSRVVDFLLRYGFGNLTFGPLSESTGEINVFSNGRKIGFLSDSVFHRDTGIRNIPSSDMIEDVLGRPFLSMKGDVIGSVDKLAVVSSHNLTIAIVKAFEATPSFNLSAEQLRNCATEDFFGIVQFV